jgi:hypothetical protein
MALSLAARAELDALGHEERYGDRGHTNREKGAQLQR